MKKTKFTKLLTCFLLGGLMLVSCNDPVVSPTDTPAPTPTPSITPSEQGSSPEESTTPEETTTLEDSSTPSVDPSDDPSNEPSDEPSDDLVPGENEELVEYKVNVSTAFEVGKASSDVINGKFTLVSGTEVRARTKTWTNPDDSTDVREFTRSVKLGSNDAQINVNVPGRGKLYLWVQNGSSGATTQFIKITKPDGSTEQIEFVGTDGGSPVVRLELDVTEGLYKINRVSGTVDIFNMELKAIVGIAAESGFEIASPGKVDFLEGEEFDYSKLLVNKVYGNGRTEDLALDDENFTIDASEYKANVPGTYTIKLNYKEYTQLTYQVVVYDVEDLKLGLDAIEKLSKNSSAGNGIYFNHSVKEVYDLNEAFDSTGLSAIVVAKNGEETKEFKIDAKNITVSGFDSSTAGKKELTVSYNFAGQSVSKALTVYVVDTAPSITQDKIVKVKVNPSYEGEIGAVVEGYNVFTTIQQALDYIEGNAGIASSDRKLIELAPGTYTEKLEITIPYLTIKGSDAETTIIEWDSIYGVADAGGFVHTTDSTATVAIREEAIGCTIEGVTISNWYNSQERLDERNTAIERALALLVQSDQFIMKDGKLLGIQDTLELFTGRQYFENVFISGYTDFIFGTNNTTYFTDCTIHTIDTLKDDGGTAGYLTAFKGSNKGSGDYITYGAIFDGCNFTADEEVSTKQAIGRTWGPYAAVAIINSEIGGHISKDGYVSTENKNKRYISMNGTHPTDETVQFVEYNNTGEGAITEAVAGMKYLDATTAANYSNLAIIFGTTNGKVIYDNEWDPTSEEIQIDHNIYYHFDGKASVTGTSYTYNQNINGTTGAFENIAIDATSGKVTARDSDTQINAGAKLIFDVDAGTTVVVSTYPTYHNYSLNGVETNSDNFAQHYTEATTVTLEANATMYLLSITIKPNQEAPEAASLDSLEIKGQKTSFVVGDEFTYEDLVVKASYSDSSLITLDPTQYEVTWDGDINVAGEYTVTVSYGDVNEQYKVTFEELGVDPSFVSKDATISFGTNGNHTTSKLITGTANIRDNGGNNTQIKGTVSLKVLAGATVKITGYSGYTNYQLSINGAEESAAITEANYEVLVGQDSTIDFICGDNHYFISIEVVYDTITKSTAISFGSDGNYQDMEVNLSGASIRDNGGNNSQISGTVKLQVLAGATVSVKSYSGYTDYTVSINGGTPGETITGTSHQFRVNEVSVVELTCGTNNYFYDIVVSYPISATTSITFGSDGNYKDSGLYFGNITVGDNGGNNSQIKNGSFNFEVKAGATVTINGYSGYTSYTVKVNDGEVSAEITDTTYVIEAAVDSVITIAPVSGNNYFYGIDVVYPVVFEENTNITFGSEGNYKDSGINLSGITVGDNGGNNSQVKDGSFTFNVKAGATVTIYGYSGYTSYTVKVNDGEVSEEITTEYYTIDVTEDSTITYTPVNGGSNYLYGISISFPLVFDSNTNITFGSEGNYKDSGIDFSNITIGDNGGNNSQIKNGSFSFNVKAGATVTINGYSGYTSYTVKVNDGEVSAEITDTTYVIEAAVDSVITITPVSGNNYFYGIDIAFS